MHIKHTDGHFEYIPYFSLPANDLTDVIAPSCYSCFDYPNALAVRAHCRTTNAFGRSVLAISFQKVLIAAFDANQEAAA